jgi:Holliday junction resolvase RusA-like endonuclease
MEVETFVSKFAPKVALDGYLEVEVIFFMPRLDGHKNKVYPNTKPDLDNCLKSLFDPVERAGVMTNDSRICDLSAKKRFAGGFGANGVIQAGSYIKIVEISDRLPLPTRQIETAS